MRLSRQISSLEDHKRIQLQFLLKVSTRYIHSQAEFKHLAFSHCGWE
jgi:hypothetical protein